MIIRQSEHCSYYGFAVYFYERSLAVAFGIPYVIVTKRFGNNDCGRRMGQFGLVRRKVQFNGFPCVDDPEGILTGSLTEWLIGIKEIEESNYKTI